MYQFPFGMNPYSMMNQQQLQQLMQQQSPNMYGSQGMSPLPDNKGAAPQLPNASPQQNSNQNGGLTQALATLLGGAGAGQAAGMMGGGGNNSLMSLLANMGGGLGAGQLFNLFGGK